MMELLEKILSHQPLLVDIKSEGEPIAPVIIKIDKECTDEYDHSHEITNLLGPQPGCVTERKKEKKKEVAPSKKPSDAQSGEIVPGAAEDEKETKKKGKKA